MSVYGHNPNAFNDWYRDVGTDDESLAEFQRSIADSDAMSRFSLEVSRSIVSDDTVDAELWLSIRGMTPDELNLDWGIPQ